MGRIKGNKSKRTKAAAIVAAIAFTAAAMAGGGGTETAKAEPPLSVDIACSVGGILPLTVPAWACPAALSGHFYGWWLTPSATPPPSGYPVQSDKINADGSVGTSGDPAVKMDETLMYILAVGSRGQGAFADPSTWIADGAKAQVDRSTNGGTGATATSWVKSQIAATCPVDVSVAYGARIGYTLWSVDEKPEEITPACDVRAKVKSTFNSSTGQYGSSLADTVWSVIALESWGDGPSLSSATTSYILSQRNANGGWGSGPDGYDYVLTSRTLMALLQLGVAPADPVFSTALSLFGATQNADGGWGKLPDKSPRSETVATALIHGIVQRLDALGLDDAWNPAVFTKGTDGLSGSGGRMGVQYPLQVLSQDQIVSDAQEGKFYKYIGPLGGAKDPADAASDQSTLPTASVLFYAFFSDPVRGDGTPSNPTTPTNNDPGQGSITEAIVPTAVVATPTVTG